VLGIQVSFQDGVCGSSSIGSLQADLIISLSSEFHKELLPWGFV
jgi:hypothetical protein